MRELQAKIIADLGAKPSIDPPAEIRRRIGFLTNYLRAVGAQGLILGISGGQDSSLAGRLCQLAAEELADDGHPICFTAVRLPYKVQADEDDALLALEFIRPQTSISIDIGPGVDGVAEGFAAGMGMPLRDFNKGNVKARVRMTVQYAVAGHDGALVAGTDHAAEAVTGFYTKFGDGGTDVLPLSGLNKRQGRALLVELGAPRRLYEKVPTADLLDDEPGQTDEASLGVTYEQIDDYLEGRDIGAGAAAVVESHYLASRHKRHPPVAVDDSWWQS